MELGLSLGEAPPTKAFSPAWKRGRTGGGELRLGFCVGLGGEREAAASAAENDERLAEDRGRWSTAVDPPVQLDLLPFSPVPRLASSSSPPRKMDFSWPPPVNGSSDWCSGGLDVNQAPPAAEMDAAAGAMVLVSSSPNSAVDLSGTIGGAAANDGSEGERACSRASDEEENGRARKKLRLSKDQSAFLEESFREHNTLNPKQKIALAKQLNLRPRQVEVWFQNRRARTKLKQTEVDCEYLKSCCERLTEENRRLHKELQELRALKTSHPFYMQLPATTLTMCPSCERVATASTACSSAAASRGAAAPPPGKPQSSQDLRPPAALLTPIRSLPGAQHQPATAAPHQPAASYLPPAAG